MLNTGLLLLLLVGFVVFSVFNFRRLAVIHALSNNSKGAALETAVIALTSDTESKRQLARLIGGREQLEAAHAANEALSQAKYLLDQHNRGQRAADRV
jgi:hypothetical protein